MKIYKSVYYDIRGTKQAILDNGGRAFLEKYNGEVMELDAGITSRRRTWGSKVQLQKY